MHDIINNNSYNTENSNVHNYNTRSAARKNLYQPQSKIKYKF